MVSGARMANTWDRGGSSHQPGGSSGIISKSFESRRPTSHGVGVDEPSPHESGTIVTESRPKLLALKGGDGPPPMHFRPCAGHAQAMRRYRSAVIEFYWTTLPLKAIDDHRRRRDLGTSCKARPSATTARMGPAKREYIVICATRVPDTQTLIPVT